MDTTEASAADLDVAIIGAGISGIGIACHLRRSLPHKRFAILEGRDAIGGTWDLFRYPGIRSDSDLQTFAYAFKPWTRARAIAPAGEILDYLAETVAEYDLARDLRLGHRVVAADFSREDARWTLTVEHGGVEQEITAKVLFAATGYYDYDTGFTPPLPGRERFAGEIVHPQAWPGELDYAGKRVVVIGSGATAMTVVPAMTDQAAHVTMLQRSPTYVLSLPAKDPVANALQAVLPDQRAYDITRWMNIKRQQLFYRACRRAPKLMRRLLRRMTKLQLPRDYPVDVHFKPRYDPWDERPCVVPDGDLFKALRAGRASIVTDRIDAFVERGIRLASGAVLDADVVVTATGLNLRLLGGVDVRVDGEAVDPGSLVVYKSMMFSGIPNCAFSVGYTNISWTLKVDLVAEHLCRILERMDAAGHATFEPVLPDDGMPRRPFLDFQAGYVQRAIDRLPKQGTSEPWTVAMSYAMDRKRLVEGPVDDDALRFGAPAGAATPV